MFSLRNNRPSVRVTVALAIPLVAAGLLTPSPGAAQQATAAVTAYTTANVNQRAGPGTDFPVIVTVPVRTRIGLYGCLRPVDWCDVEFNRNRGWMSADYIQAWYQGQYYPLRQVSRQLSIAVVSFDIDAYWRAYYRDRPFYADLPRWRAPDRPPSINVNVFYDRLAPHGRWVWLNGRYVWVPAAAGPDWRPYTHGRWVYTQRYGWMWVSDEPHGWATHHYGRWAFSKRIGWFWVPDTRWGPAWVSWRGSDEYLAWAPLPPSHQEGFYFDISVGTAVPDYYWQVVPAQSFLTVNIFNVIIKDRERSHEALQQAEPLGTVEIVDDEAVNAAVPVVFVEEKTQEAVVPLQVVETDNPDQAGATEGDAIEVFTPPPEEAVEEAPPEVTPIEVVEEESETKDQAGEEPATEDLVEPPPETAAEPPPAGEEPPAAEEEPPTADEEPPTAEEAEEPPPPPPAEGEEPPPPPEEAEEPPPPPPAEEEEPPPPPEEAEEPPPPPPAEEEEPPPPPPAEAEEPPPPPPAEEEEPPPPPPAEAEEPPPPPEPEPAPPPPAEEPPPPPEPEPAPPPPPELPPPAEAEPPPPCPEGTERQEDGSCA